MSAIEYCAREVVVLSELLVHHRVEARDFGPKAVHWVLDLFRCVFQEVMRLPGHGAKAANLPIHPLQYVVLAMQLGRQELAGLFAEVLQDRPDSNKAIGPPCAS